MILEKKLKFFSGECIETEYVQNPEQRYKTGSSIPEDAFARGYGYRKNVNTVLGQLDLYLAKYRTAVFIHGCF